MPGRHNVQNALAAIAVARELGDRRRRAAPGARRLRRRQAALHPHRHRRRHHRDRRLRPPPGRDPRRARDRPPDLRRPRDRGGAAAPLHPPLRRCSRSSAPPSTMPTACWSPRSMPPARRRSPASTAMRWSRACAATATATCARSTAPSSCRPWSRASPQPGDLVVCLGAGSITAWANALPGAAAAPARARRRGVSRTCSAALPPVRGRCARERAARAAHLAARRRPGRGRVPAGRCRRPGGVPRGQAAPRLPVTPIGVASNLLVRDGGIEGVVRALRAGRSPRSRSTDERLRVGAGATDRMIAIQAHEGRACPGSSSSSASPARWAARSA